jgi:hypothetical protein
MFRIVGSRLALAVMVAVLLAISLGSRGELNGAGWWIVVAAGAAAALVGGVGGAAASYSGRHPDGRLAGFVARVRSRD